MRLENKVAIVTGGGNGIGMHYVKGLAREGAAVAVAEVDEAAAAMVADEVRREGGKALAVPTDVSDEASVQEMVNATAGAFGHVDILVNNAAVFASVPLSRAPYDEITVEEWDRVFAVNVRGMWLCCREAIKEMKKVGSGSIINISSGTAWKRSSGSLQYVTSKAAVIGLTRSLAASVGSLGIRVNAIAPGLTESESLLPRMTVENRERQIRDRIIPRAEIPEDLVGTVIFLSSEDSAFITGQILHVDGGSVLGG